MYLQHLLQKTSKLSSTYQHNSIISQYNQLFKIGSLNTRGLNNNTKLKCLLKYTTNNNYSIFGLSETKIKESSQIYYKTNKYITQWSSNESSKAGVALIINRNLFKHHFKTTSFKGYIISAFFNFKPKITLCITQIYIPHDTKNKKETISFLQNLILSNTNSNIPHIIMGDFNSTPNPLLNKLNSNKKYKKYSKPNPLYNILTN